MERFSYHRIYNGVEDEVYEKKRGLESGKIFVSQSIQ